MVGILIISHSKKVAEGVVEIARQMAGTELALEACGGDREGGIGTDPDAIAAALEKLSGSDGVVIIADLGSAVMSAELVLDTLPPERREWLIIANAPLVEGAVLAAVEAAVGKNLAEVAEAAALAFQMQKVERRR